MENKEPQEPDPNGKQGTSLVERFEVRWTLRALNTWNKCIMKVLKMDNSSPYD
jgi:hypothetical protein